MNQNNETTNFNTNNTAESTPKKRGRKPGQAVRCSYCGELGHMAKTCPQNPDRSVKSEPVSKAQKNNLHKVLLTDDELAVLVEYRKSVLAQNMQEVVQDDSGVDAVLAEDREVEESNKEAVLNTADNQEALREILASTGNLF